MTAKNIIITGGSGFIGSNTAELLSLNHKVTVIDLKKPKNEIKNVKYIQADCREIAKYEQDIKSADFIYHFAATVSVPLCQENPKETYENNFLSTVKIAEYCSNLTKKPFIVFASSASNYGNNGKLNIALKESDTVSSPISFYGAQKMNSEEALRLFYSSKRLSSLCFRFFNVYGVGQDDSSPYTGVITVFNKILKNNTKKQIVINGDGAQTRDFISVKDVAKACENTLSLKEFNGSAINIGSGLSTSIKELANTMISVSKRTDINLSHGEAREADVRYSMADISAAKKVLNWTPTVNLNTGLSELFNLS